MKRKVSDRNTINLLRAQRKELLLDIQAHIDWQLKYINDHKIIFSEIDKAMLHIIDIYTGACPHDRDQKAIFQEVEKVRDIVARKP